MKKWLIPVIVVVVIAIGVTLYFTIIKPPEKIAKRVGKEEEYAEESKAYTAEAGMYPLFDQLREVAKKEQPYPGSPGKGKKLGFANIFATLPFCISCLANKAGDQRPASSYWARSRNGIPFRSRRSVSECAMWPSLILLPTPLLSQYLCLS